MNDTDSYVQLARGALAGKSAESGVSSQSEMAVTTFLTKVQVVGDHSFLMLRGPGREQKCSELTTIFKGRVDAVMQAVFKHIPYRKEYFPVPYLTDPNLPPAHGIGFGFRLSAGNGSPHRAPGTKGVTVTEVLPNGPAAGRIEVGDVVLAIDNWATDSERDTVAAVATLRQAGRTSANVLIRRRDGRYAQVLISYEA
jgi:hypothetical protein